MSLSNEYKRQYRWRDWPTVFDALPSLKGQTIFDLGCGVGDLGAALVARGARVIGFDMNEELLHEARLRRLSDAEFRTMDLRAFENPGSLADGVWCSFTAAYFPDLPVALTLWTRNLTDGGWIALTEIDNLFGHEPLSEEAKAILSAYDEEAFAAGIYDFRMGRKLKGYLESSGFNVVKQLILEDRELAFSGPARSDVLDAWRARFERMRLLRDFCGSCIGRVQAEFLGCLMHAEHRSVAKVICCIATKAGSDLKMPGLSAAVASSRG
jgi:ubiquinone/menaquinone biosynthesis C-methylase UbiE